MTSDSRIFEVELQELSAVCFVRDYVELQFDGKIVRALTLPKVRLHNCVVVEGDPGWRDSLCSLIGRQVRVVEFASGTADRALKLKFDEDAELTVSLGESGRIGPEAMHYVPGDNEPIEVW
jgi:hypothetical protein